MDNMGAPSILGHLHMSQPPHKGRFADADSPGIGIVAHLPYDSRASRVVRTLGWPPVFTYLYLNVEHDQTPEKPWKTSILCVSCNGVIKTIGFPIKAGQSSTQVWNLSLCNKNMQNGRWYEWRSSLGFPGQLLPQVIPDIHLTGSDHSWSYPEIPAQAGHFKTQRHFTIKEKVGKTKKVYQTEYDTFFLQHGKYVHHPFTLFQAVYHLQRLLDGDAFTVRSEWHIPR